MAYEPLAALTVDYERWRSEARKSGNSAFIAATARVGFWLQQIKNGETPERTRGLAEAVAMLTQIKAKSRS